MTRLFKAACSVLSIISGVLFAIVSATNLITGQIGPFGVLLGASWAVAGVVCGIETWRGPLVLARTIRQLQEGRSQ